MKTPTYYLVKKPIIAYLCDSMHSDIFHFGILKNISLPVSFGHYGRTYLSLKNAPDIYLTRTTLGVNRYIEIINEYRH